MTEKRFTIKEFSTLDAMSSLDVICDNGIELPSSTACDLLNEQHEQINTLCESRRKLISANNDYRMRETELAQELSALADENEELKQRNNRQAKQLDRLYHLIEEKDWRALFDIIDDFKRCEEQLQKEWGTYGDVE